MPSVNNGNQGWRSTAQKGASRPKPATNSNGNVQKIKRTSKKKGK